MKKVLLSVVLFVLALSVAFAQDKASAEKKDGPVITFDEPSHDFGDIEEGVVVNHKFKFKNTGNQPLILANVITSCGCTSPEWPKEPILPGKSGKIKVRYNTQGRGNQPFDKSVYISSNASTNNERYELHIKGFVTGADQTTGKK